MGQDSKPDPKSTSLSLTPSEQRLTSLRAGLCQMGVVFRVPVALPGLDAVRAVGAQVPDPVQTQPRLGPKWPPGQGTCSVSRRKCLRPNKRSGEFVATRAQPSVRAHLAISLCGRLGPTRPPLWGLETRARCAATGLPTYRRVTRGPRRPATRVDQEAGFCYHKAHHHSLLLKPT